MITTVPGHADADAITILWGMPTGSVYRWASLDRWRRQRVGRRVVYDLDDVDRTMIRLHGDAT